MTLLNTTNPTSVSTVPSRQRPGFSQAVRALVAVMMARRELGRIVRNNQSRGSPPLSPHLRKDLGLAEYQQEPWRAFDNW